jgi:hypothetical protein
MHHIIADITARTMSMISRRAKSMKGFTLVDVMLATATFIIAVLGTSAYRYNAALIARRADLQTTAARTALLFCEGWCGERGDPNFNPIGRFSGDLDIQQAGSSPAAPTGFTLLGTYEVVLEGTTYFVTLSRQDVNGLRALNIIVAWDQHGSGTNQIQDADKQFKLTSYVEP